jgi:HAMP domain-containing protein
MKLRVKILSGFLILAIMLACAGVVSIYELLSIGSSFNSLLSDNYKRINAAKSMIEALENEDSGVLQILAGQWQKGRETIESGDRSFRQAFETAKGNITIPNEDKYVERISADYRGYKDLWSKSLAGMDTKQNLNWYFEEIHEAFQTVKKSVEDLMLLNDEAIYQTASSMHDRAHRAIMPGIVAIISALVFVLVFNYFINFYVIKPISILVREVKNNIKTRGTIDIEIDSKDELHDLATAIKEFAAERQR